LFARSAVLCGVKHALQKAAKKQLEARETSIDKVELKLNHYQH
jgi:hypothetical protein